MQIPIATIRVLLLSEPELAQMDPVPVEEIESRFSVIGDRRSPLLQRLLRRISGQDSEGTSKDQKDKDKNRATENPSRNLRSGIPLGKLPC